MFASAAPSVVAPCGPTSAAWLPRPSHRTAPVLDALERDEASWRARSVEAVRSGGGWFGADGNGGGGGGSNGSNGGGDGGGGGSGRNSDGSGGDNHSNNSHHRILGYAVRNPEDIGLDRTVPPPPPLHVSRARLGAAADQPHRIRYKKLTRS